MNAVPPLPPGHSSLGSSVATSTESSSALSRIGSILLLVSTITAVLSALAFLGYLLAPTLTRSQPRSNFVVLYTIGLVGGAVAEGCQILTVITLLANCLLPSNREKKLSEPLILFVSLFPYVLEVIFLITLFAYLRARRLARTSERTREKAQELKEQTVNMLIDASGNMSNNAASASTSGAATQSMVAKPTIKDAVRQVVGPATSKSVSEAATGLVGVAMVTLLLSTVVTAGVVVPAQGLAPLSSSSSLLSDRHGMPSDVPLPSGATFKFVLDSGAWAWTTSAPTDPPALHAFYQSALVSGGWTHIGDGTLLLQGSTVYQMSGCHSNEDLVVSIGTFLQSKVTPSDTLTAPPGGAALAIVVDTDPTDVSSVCS